MLIQSICYVSGSMYHRKHKKLYITMYISHCCHSMSLTQNTLFSNIPFTHVIHQECEHILVVEYLLETWADFADAMSSALWNRDPWIVSAEMSQFVFGWICTSDSPFQYRQQQTSRNYADPVSRYVRLAGIVPSQCLRSG